MKPAAEPRWLPWAAAALALLLTAAAGAAWCRPAHALQWLQLFSALCGPAR